MKISEAKAIVGKMIRWSMLSIGVDVEMPEPITEDLETLLKANKIVERANKRSRLRSEKTLKTNGMSGRTVSMTLDPRGIAALYVAANFHGDSPSTADILATHQNNIVFCINKNYL